MLFQPLDFVLAFEDIKIDLRNNLIRNVDLSHFKNPILKSSKFKESTKLQNITLKIDNISMKCDCSLREFVPFIKGKFIEGSQIYFRFLIENVYCTGSDYIANKSIINLEMKDIKCKWSSVDENDACHKICDCWQFLEIPKIVADCSKRNLTQIPNLVGNYKNWTIELDVSGNRIENLSYLKNNILKNIQVLDLSNNSISSISTEIFSESLRILKLNDNNITKFDNSLIHYLNKTNISLINLTLFDNPWICDCDAQKLTLISSIKNDLNMKKTHCKIDNALLFKVNFTDLCDRNHSFSHHVIQKVSYYCKVFELGGSLVFLLVLLYCYFNLQIGSLKKSSP